MELKDEIRIEAPRGAAVKAGEPLATILHGRGGAPSSDLQARLGAAFTLADEAPPAVAFILERIG